jgi:hypothetical protein
VTAWQWLCDALRMDGIRDDEIPPECDAQWLTPLERLGVQTRDDAEVARHIIAQRKAQAQR